MSDKHLKEIAKELRLIRIELQKLFGPETDTLAFLKDDEPL